MEKIFTFFVNAVKAIIFSPFYLLYLAIYLVISLFNHVFGEIKVLFTGFKYGSKKENKYHRTVVEKFEAIKKAGEAQWCFLLLK